MKKLICLFSIYILAIAGMIIALADSAYAQYLEDAVRKTTTVVEEVTSDKPRKQEHYCPVHADTPRQDIERPPWELDFRMNVLDTPSNGGYQFHIDNLDIRLTHNLSNTLYAYAWVGNRSVEKINYEDAAYDKEWKSQMVFGGFGIYLTPVIKVFGGAGWIFLENDDGEPELELPVERGIGYDIPWGGNKFVIEYRFIDAKLKDKPHVSEAPADGSFSSVSIAYTVQL